MERKITKGKEDGTYTYTFGSNTNIADQAKKKSIAQIILDNAKKGNAKNPKIENGKTSSEEEVKKVLAIKNYQAGDTITFKLLKKVPEFLYLHAKAQGEKQHDKKFLNKEGAYFQIGNKCPRCNVLTREEIKGVFPSLSDENIIEEMINSFNKYCEAFKINTCTLKAHFFAQAKQESGDKLTPAFKGETMDYTVTGLKNTGFLNVSSRYLFGRKTGIQMAEELGRPTPSSPSLTQEQQIKVANFVYGLDPKAATLGNKAPANNQSLSENDNEGWRYRGRGMLQITGKDNYTKIEKHVNEVLKSNVLNIKDGRRGSEVFTLTEALLTGLGDWHMHKMYEPAEAGVTKEACLGVIRIINSATKSKTKRIAHLIGGTWYEKDDKKEKSYDIAFKDSMASIFRVSECNQEEASIEDACTEDCSQCFNYANVWENPEISNDNGGKNNNRFGFNSSRGHKGIDIVSGPQYKDVHSLMCGEVTSVVKSFETNEYRSKSLGNTVMIKSKDKNGQTVFILYCHLDKIYVKSQEKVRHGQKIALSGSTGNASSDEFPNGVKGRGINKKFWHVHIEAATRGDKANNFLNLGSYRIKAEDYMKTKFDNNGNPIK